MTSHVVAQDSDQSGNWADNSTWGSSDGETSPGCKISGNDDVVVVHDVIIQETTCPDGLEVTGSGALTIQSGAELWIKSDAGLKGNSNIVVEDGATLKISGDFSTVGNDTAINNGSILIQGVGCDNFTGTGTCSENEPLPVTLNAFEGEYDNGSVTLHWSTVSEINFDHFEVQRREKDNKFKTIGSVEGVGNTNSLQYYSFEDHAPEKGNNYYRLKAVDIDGTVEYHDIIAVNVPFSAPSVQIMPNPVDGKFFKTKSKVEGATMTILSNHGQQIASFSLQEGMNEIRPHQSLQQGIYLVMVQQNGKIIHRDRIVVSR